MGHSPTRDTAKTQMRAKEENPKPQAISSKSLRSDHTTPSGDRRVRKKTGMEGLTFIEVASLAKIAVATGGIGEA
ncbi:hypothetical protein JTB14_008274 [Gonioctena quinquepunctata]|nr:hypothetical protein JTB14_008274 [Gonioctena quinquepunctata]